AAITISSASPVLIPPNNFVFFLACSSCSDNSEKSPLSNPAPKPPFKPTFAMSFDLSVNSRHLWFSAAASAPSVLERYSDKNSLELLNQGLVALSLNPSNRHLDQSQSSKFRM